MKPIILPRRWSASLLLVGALPAAGQTLRVSSAGGAPGDAVALQILLDSGAGPTPAALKWQIVFPAQLLDVAGNEPEAGSAAAEAGKTLTCVAPQVYSYVCVLAGGVKPLGSGAIAILRFKIRAEARAGTSVVVIDQVDGVTRDLKTLTFGKTEGRILIR